MLVRLYSAWYVWFVVRQCFCFANGTSWALYYCDYICCISRGMILPDQTSFCTVRFLLPPEVFAISPTSYEVEPQSQNVAYVVVIELEYVLNWDDCCTIVAKLVLSCKHCKSKQWHEIVKRMTFLYGSVSNYIHKGTLPGLYQYYCIFKYSLMQFKYAVLAEHLTVIDVPRYNYLFQQETYGLIFNLDLKRHL